MTKVRFPSVQYNMRTEPLARCCRRSIHDVLTHNTSSPIPLIDAQGEYCYIARHNESVIARYEMPCPLTLDKRQSQERLGGFRIFPYLYHFSFSFKLWTSTYLPLSACIHWARWSEREMVAGSRSLALVPQEPFTARDQLITEINKKDTTILSSGYRESNPFLRLRDLILCTTSRHMNTIPAQPDWLSVYSNT